MIILFVIIELFHKKINNPDLWVAQKLMIIYASIKNHNYTNLLKLGDKYKPKIKSYLLPPLSDLSLSISKNI